MFALLAVDALFFFLPLTRLAMQVLADYTFQVRLPSALASGLVAGACVHVEFAFQPDGVMLMTAREETGGAIGPMLSTNKNALVA